MNSPNVHALARAARSGKQIVVVLELKARFDEEKNISWAAELEQAGVIVTFGVARLNVNAKASLVISSLLDGSISRYLHLSTGNYNEKTGAQLCGLLPVHRKPGALHRYRPLFQHSDRIRASSRSRSSPSVPLTSGAHIALIDREAPSPRRSPQLHHGETQLSFRSGHHRGPLPRLFQGVQIKPQCAGCLHAHSRIAGLSETIEEQSVLGRYLEHRRMLYFRNGGSEELYLSSADWLHRNMKKRGRTSCSPCSDSEIKAPLQ